MIVKGLMSKPQKNYAVKLLEEFRSKIISESSRMNRTANTSGMAESIFRQYIEPIIDAYKPVLSPLAEHHGNRLYRARKCVGGQPFTDINELYNPTTPSGRAVINNQLPILYASSSKQTCLAEIDPKIGDYINVIQLDYTNILDGKFWFVGQIGAVHKSNETSRYLGDQLPARINVYFSENAQHSWIFKDLLINEIFSDLSSESDNYALNRFLIESIKKKLSTKEDLHGVVFLSTKDSPGNNFAIFGESIKKLKPNIVNFLKIVDIDEYGIIEYKLLKNCQPHNGSLQWPEHELENT